MKKGTFSVGISTGNERVNLTCKISKAAQGMLISRHPWHCLGEASLG